MLDALPRAVPAAAPERETARPLAGIYELVALHALTWLLLANLVGLLLATLLLAPRLGDALAPFTYGRWMALHLDLHLYGWVSLPLVGLLLRLYLPAGEPGPWPRRALGLWSGCLLFGAVSWLAGESSGKLFLDWAGPARALLALTLTLLAGVLAVSFRRRLARGEEPRRAVAVAKGAFLALLLPVPAVLVLAADPTVYPPINPDSGGATGGSLLGSVLGIVALFLALPSILGLEARRRRPRIRRLALLLGAHFALFLLLDHGDHSHHEAGQILALASVAVWPPLLARHLGRFRWPAGSGPWLAALGAWGGALVASGLVAFLPGVLERWKFTNVLVGHAHIALAGLVTSFNALALLALLAGTPRAAVFARRGPFRLWHGGCAVFVVAVTALGMWEGARPGLLFEGGGQALYAARWLGGAMMTAACAWWLVAASISPAEGRRREAA